MLGISIYLIISHGNPYKIGGLETGERQEKSPTIKDMCIKDNYMRHFGIVRFSIVDIGISMKLFFQY